MTVKKSVTRIPEFVPLHVIQLGEKPHGSAEAPPSTQSTASRLATLMTSWLQNTGFVVLGVRRRLRTPVSRWEHSKDVMAGHEGLHNLQLLRLHSFIAHRRTCSNSRFSYSVRLEHQRFTLSGNPLSSTTHLHRSTCVSATSTRLTAN